MKYNPSFFLETFYEEQGEQTVIEAADKDYEMHMLMDQACFDWAKANGAEVFYHCADEAGDWELLDLQRMLDTYEVLNASAHIKLGFYDVKLSRNALGLPPVPCLFDRFVVGQVR